MKTGPKPRLITTQLLEQIEFLALEDFLNSRFVMLLESVRLGGMTLNKKFGYIGEFQKRQSKRPCRGLKRNL